MVQLTRIYTKGGDKGKTSLGNGERRFKNTLRIQSIGDVDESNAALGVVRLHVGPQLDAILKQIQNDLFDLGADLCMPDEMEGALRIAASQVTWLETQIDHLNESLSPLTSFVLPGGTPASAHLHAARTVVRRAERKVVACAAEEEVSTFVVQYLNRLSDLLFVMARYANNLGKEDVLWVPGQGQGAAKEA